MRAILSKFEPKYNQYRNVGTDGRTITKEYKSLATLYRYGIRPYLKMWDGKLKAEIWYNWNNRYKDPNKVMTWNTHIFDR